MTTSSSANQANATAQCGLASLLLGGILAILAILILQLNLHMFLGPKVWAESDVRSLRIVAIAGTVFLAVMNISSLSLGARSLLLAKRTGNPAELGWAGLLISAFALLLWIGALADLFAVLDVLLRRFG